MRRAPDAVRRPDLDELLDGTAKAPVFVLALPEPLLQRAVGLGRSFPRAGNVGIRRYVEQ